MQQVININFHGRIIPIETKAYDKLKAYTESLHKHFANEEGKEEIINDIESRIGELFQERIKQGAVCITDSDVEAVIKSIGRPEEFDGEPSASTESASSTHSSPKTKRLFRDENNKVVGGVCSGLANYLGIDVVVIRIIFVVAVISFGFGLLPYLILWIATPSSASKEIGGTRKRLYRDDDNKIIAGVCSGIGHYFGIDPWIPRVLFLIPLLTAISRWDDIINLSPGALIAYIICWIAIPYAKTTSEKLEMKGEKVDMNSIKTTVMSEMKGVESRLKEFSKEATTVAKEKSEAMAGEVKKGWKNSTGIIGKILITLVKIFVYFILAIIMISLFAVLFSISIASFAIFPLKGFVLNEGWQTAFAWGTLLFFIITPMVWIITSIIRWLTKAKSSSRLLTTSFFTLFVLGAFSLAGLINSIVKEFRSTNDTYEQEVALSNPAVGKLELVALPSNNNININEGVQITELDALFEDTLYTSNISIQILKSPNDSFRVTTIKKVNGNNRKNANAIAENIHFNLMQRDSILTLDGGIPITRDNKFRNQRVIVTVYVPEGKRIKIGKNIGMFSDNDIDEDVRKAIFPEMIEQKWESGVEYIMKADGLYTIDGQRAGKRKNEKQEDWNDQDIEPVLPEEKNEAKPVRTVKNKIKTDRRPNAPAMLEILRFNPVIFIK
jgi:phage shock protein PspC (stress-responsive transcriptional regulator)